MKNKIISYCKNQTDGKSVTNFYIQSINKYPVLTPEQEISLGKQLIETSVTRKQLASILNLDLSGTLNINKSTKIIAKLGLFDNADALFLVPIKSLEESTNILDKLVHEGQLSNQQKNQLIELIKKVPAGGVTIKQQLVNANLRFVISIAKKYVKNGWSLMDLVSEGNIGLILAAGRFDYRRGNRFITHAHWWVKQSIFNALHKSSWDITIPVNKSRVAIRFIKTLEYLEEIYQRAPKIQEIAQELSLSEEAVVEFLEIIRPMDSLDEAVNEDNSTTIRDFVHGDAQYSPESIMGRAELKELLNTVLADLSERERIVLIHRYGLHNLEEKSLAATGAYFGITREAVRQIQIRATTKLRRHQLLKDEKDSLLSY